jgi:hypothetical protein
MILEFPLSVHASEWIGLLESALAAERRATVERIRAALLELKAMDFQGRAIHAILDAEAAK